MSISPHQGDPARRFDRTVAAPGGETTSAATPQADCPVPIADWISPLALSTDPYPTYQRLRREAPIAWVPVLNRYLVTTHADCWAIEQDQETYTADLSGIGAIMNRALGGSAMLRKDDPDHASERGTINPVLRPKAVTEVWAPIFERNARACLDMLDDAGPSQAELNQHYAAPLASQNLIDLIGMKDVQPKQMRYWSHALIAEIENLHDDPAISKRCVAAGKEIDDHLTELIPLLQRHPDQSLTSALVNSGLPRPSVVANVKLIISGGMNEPQHMTTSMVWALCQNPDQLRQVLADDALWPGVFDETARWLSPIGMYPRETTREVTLGGIALPAGAALGVVIGSANRDESHYLTDPARFDIFRARQGHLAFGSGVHQCAGRWAARVSIGQIAVPLLFHRFPGLAIDSLRETHWDGWVFRGLEELPVTWNS